DAPPDSQVPVIADRSTKATGRVPGEGAIADGQDPGIGDRSTIPSGVAGEGAVVNGDVVLVVDRSTRLGGVPNKGTVDNHHVPDILDGTPGSGVPTGEREGVQREALLVD